jgi:hypothetical protein
MAASKVSTARPASSRAALPDFTQQTASSRCSSYAAVESRLTRAISFPISPTKWSGEPDFARSASGLRIGPAFRPRCLRSPRLCPNPPPAAGPLPNDPARWLLAVLLRPCFFPFQFAQINAWDSASAYVRRDSSCWPPSPAPTVTSRVGLTRDERGPLHLERAEESSTRAGLSLVALLHGYGSRGLAARSVSRKLSAWRFS